MSVDEIGGPPVKTMAEVIRAHQYDSEKRTMHQHCTCGWFGKVLGFDFWEHLADALAAAGYGPVKEAQAGAWDAAVNEADRQWQIGHASAAILKADNPYRAATKDAEP